MVTETPALGVVIPPAPPWYTVRAREIWVDTWEAGAWRAGTVAAVEAEEATVVDARAGLIINVVVGAVVFALFNEVPAGKETGMLTSVPV